MNIDQPDLVHVCIDSLLRINVIAITLRFRRTFHGGHAGATLDLQYTCGTSAMFEKLTATMAQELLRGGEKPAHKLSRLGNTRSEKLETL